MLIQSGIEEVMVEVLKASSKPLTLNEIVELIHKKDSSVLAGATPTKSLYSVVLRREQRRKELKLKPLFVVSKERGRALYCLNK